MVKRIEYKTGSGIHTYHYETETDSPYSLLICHGGGGSGGIYDDFCLPFIEATRADVWSWDHPGFGMSGVRGEWTFEEAYNGIKAVIAEIKAQHDKPIFVLGSSFGAVIASACAYLDDVAGVIIQGSFLAVGTPLYEQMTSLFSNPAMDLFLGSPFGQASLLPLDKMINWEENYGGVQKAREITQSPQHTGEVKLQSFASSFSWKGAPYPMSKNTKPFAIIIAERDPMLVSGGGPDAAQSVIESIGGPTKLTVKDSDKHQLMLFHTDWFIQELHGFITSHL